ncbi:MAG: FemAB family XrtA/PEP-CTERM system-associated protein [Rhodovibrio sp.]|nr:FemAB family XrtA/PEP-CTERM system-associated protein [Rhodovibrio sp.]
MSERRPVTVEALAPGREADWDAFVRGHPQGTVFHLSAWKPVIERAFRQQGHLLAAWRGQELVGVLPLTHLKNRLFPSALVANAFCVTGGPLALDAEARRRLDAAALALAERLAVHHLEYRLGAAAADATPGAGWQRKDDLYVTFRKPITADHDANMKAIPRKQRAMVRKAIGFGLDSHATRDTDAFFRVYAESVRNLGTPVFTRRYPRLLQEAFGGDCETLLITHEGRPVSAVMSLFFKGEVLPYYGGGTAAARGLAANDFMYWEVMRRAAERGCTSFDFGRSKVSTGAYAFKKNWGFAPAPLAYDTRLVRGRELAEVNPLNPKYARRIQAWQRLPLAVANALGPPIARELG